MKNTKKIFLYILLNVAVTLSVFFVAYKWIENKYLTDIIPTPIPNMITSANPTPTLIPIQIDLPSGDQVADILDIVMVVGAGDATTEHIQIKNIGDETISLLGWSLLLDKTQVYQFPSIKLYPNSAIRLFTKPGTNTVHQIFIGNTASQWKSGDTLILADPAGNPQSTYNIP